MITIKNYCEADIQFVIDNFQNMTISEIADRLGKTCGSIQNAARKLGLVKQPHKAWTQEEIEYLQCNYGQIPVVEIAKTLGRTAPSINACAKNLQLYKDVPWTKEDEQYLRENYTVLTHAEMATILHRTEGAVRSKCFNLDLYKKELPWTQDDADFVREHYMEMPTADIARILNRTHNAVRLRAERMGYKKYPYMCDYEYFANIDTEEKAYWLGFLTADGWISKNSVTGSGCVGVELQYGDIEHLRKFNKSLHGNYQITDRWRPCLLSKDKYKKHHSCVLRIFSITMYDALVRLGFTNAKSFDSYVPDIPQDLLRHYIRGYFDGNGSISVSHNHLTTSISTASKTLSQNLLDIFNNLGWLTTDYITITDNNIAVHDLRMNKRRDQLQFILYMYQDASIYLDRKYKKYLKAIQFFGTEHEYPPVAKSMGNK